MNRFVIYVPVIFSLLACFSNNVPAPSIGRYKVSACTQIKVVDKRGQTVHEAGIPSFVGVVLGANGVSKPFYTDTNKSVSAQVAASLLNALHGAGVRVLEKGEEIEPTCRILLLTMNDWRIDTRLKTKFVVDATLALYEGNGFLLESAAIDEVIELDGSSLNPEGAARQHFLKESEFTISTLLEDPKLQRVL